MTTCQLDLDPTIVPNCVNIHQVSFVAICQLALLPSFCSYCYITSSSNFCDGPSSRSRSISLLPGVHRLTFWTLKCCHHALTWTVLQEAATAPTLVPLVFMPGHPGNLGSVRLSSSSQLSRLFHLMSVHSVSSWVVCVSCAWACPSKS